jgi:hypothetical protein
MPEQKQTWDTRGWLVGIIGGGLSGGLFVVSFIPQVASRLDAVLPNGQDWAGGLLGVLGLLLLPAILSGVSRRYTFLWGLVPLLLFLLCIVAGQAAFNNWQSIGGVFWPTVSMLGIAWAIASGPVSLIRWLRVRAARRHEALLASYQAQRGAASVPQEGVWPPPPEYREQEDRRGRE